MSADRLPTISLQPVADPHHRWCALMACGAELAGLEPLRAFAGHIAALELLDAILPLPLVVPLKAVPDIDDELAQLLPATRIVLCIPAEAAADEAGADSLGRLAARHYRILCAGMPPPGQAHPAFAGLALRAESAPPFLTAGQHLALGVDSFQAFHACRDVGFQWLAGRYPLHPPPDITGKGPARNVLLKLVAQISCDADSHDIEASLKQDPQLSAQLLNLVNSVSFSLNKRISSFGQAIALLGRRQLRRWLQLLLYARPPGPGSEASPLLPRAALRAGLMEGLCRAAGGDKDMLDGAFMVGMFSLLEALLGKRLPELVEPLNLAEPIANALLNHAGPFGTWLRVVETADGGLANDLPDALASAGIDPETWLAEQVQACRWAIQVSREA